jgi:hypothetical protein
MALIVVLSALLASSVSAAAADHELKVIPSNTHTGSFDARIKPVLRIAPGDIVKVETLVPFGMDRLLAAGASASRPREASANCASRVVQACAKGRIDQTSTDLANGADGLLRTV